MQTARLTDLTPKQLAFCRYVADGKTYSDAYRMSYDTKAGMRSVNSTASAMMRDPRISGRVDMLVKAKEQALLRSSLGEREQVLSRLRTLADTATSADLAKLRATELWGKAVGVFDTKSEAPDDTDLSAAEIEVQLKAKLTELLGGDIEGEYTMIGTDSDSTDTGGVLLDDAPT